MTRSLRPRPRPASGSSLARSLAASGLVHGGMIGAGVLFGLVFGLGGGERAPREYAARFELPVVAASFEEVHEEFVPEVPAPLEEDPRLRESEVWAEAEPSEPLEPEPVPEPRLRSVDWLQPPSLALGEVRVPAPTRAPSTEVLPQEPPPAPIRASVLPVARPTGPVPRHTPDPTYPRLSRRSGEEGSVLARLELDAEGRVHSVTIVESSGHERLDEAVRTALATWSFEPAREDGRAVATTIQHRVTFRLDS